MALDRELALAEQARREAIYDARDAEGDRPSALPSFGEPPPVRGPLETLPDGTPVTWKRTIALVALAISALAGIVQQVWSATHPSGDVNGQGPVKGAQQPVK